MTALVTLPDPAGINWSNGRAEVNVLGLVDRLEQAGLFAAQDVHEFRKDLRVLYDSQRTGLPSARLEQPVPPISIMDGGE